MKRSLRHDFFRLLAAACVVLIGALDGFAEQPIRVVTTLSTFADLAKAIGGDRVDVASIAPAKFNAHFIEPKPSDVLRVKRAQLFINAGLDLELWRGPLLDAAGNVSIQPNQPGELDLSRGIQLLEVPDHPVSRAEGDMHLYGNPHYWTDPENGRVMAQAIADKLAEIDPAHREEYKQRLQEWTARLDAKLPEWKSRLSAASPKEVVGYHNEWPYLMHFLGLRMEAFLEPKPGIPPTPKQIERLETYVREKSVKAIVQPTYVPRQAADSLAKRTGATVVVLCQNVGELPTCGDYIGMVEHNVASLAAAMAP